MQQSYSTGCKAALDISPVQHATIIQSFLLIQSARRRRRMPGKNPVLRHTPPHVAAAVGRGPG